MNDPFDEFVGTFPDEWWDTVRELFHRHCTDTRTARASCAAIVNECKSLAAKYDVIATTMREIPDRAMAAAESATRINQGRARRGGSSTTSGRSAEPSEAQLTYLKRLGYKGTPATKAEASQIIDTLANKGDGSKKSRNGKKEKEPSAVEEEEPPTPSDDESPFLP